MFPRAARVERGTLRNGPLRCGRELHNWNTMTTTPRYKRRPAHTPTHQQYLPSIKQHSTRNCKL
eukprot:12627896-Alexandrium_andersonii.AAC.1